MYLLDAFFLKQFTRSKKGNKHTIYIDRKYMNKQYPRDPGGPDSTTELSSFDLSSMGESKNQSLAQSLLIQKNMLRVPPVFIKGLGLITFHNHIDTQVFKKTIL